jgi:hypothetical protein
MQFDFDVMGALSGIALSDFPRLVRRSVMLAERVFDATVSSLHPPIQELQI